MEGYSVKITGASKEFSKKERVMLKDTSDAVKLDEIINEGCPAVIIKPTDYAILLVHNEKSDHKDYNVYLILAEDGTKYVTGSEAFWTQFSDIWDEMNDGEDEEPWELKCYKLDSKNFKGKQFLTCSII